MVINVFIILIMLSPLAPLSFGEGSGVRWGEVFAQTELKPTEQFIISGKLKTELKVTLTDLTKYTPKSIKDVVITNHAGVVKSTLKNIKVIPLKPILDKIEIEVDMPKLLNQYYLTFVASDGYKVVYSWNEIFNTEVGNKIYVIIENDGKKITDMEERIALITDGDFKTGRRYIKNFEKIIVSRVE
ncbi:MAG: molybdopterin-binding protein [Bacteroidia bacterium]